MSIIIHRFRTDDPVSPIAFVFEYEDGSYTTFNGACIAKDGLPHIRATTSRPRCALLSVPNSKLNPLSIGMKPSKGFLHTRLSASSIRHYDRLINTNPENYAWLSVVLGRDGIIGHVRLFGVDANGIWGLNPDGTLERYKSLEIGPRSFRSRYLGTHVRHQVGWILDYRQPGAPFREPAPAYNAEGDSDN